MKKSKLTSKPAMVLYWLLTIALSCGFTAVIVRGISPNEPIKKVESHVLVQFGTAAMPYFSYDKSAFHTSFFQKENITEQPSVSLVAGIDDNLFHSLHDKPFDLTQLVAPICTLIATVCLGFISWSFNSHQVRNNQRQLRIKHRELRHQTQLSETELVSKLIPLLNGDNERIKQGALVAVGNLVSTKLAVSLASIYSSQGTTIALEEFKDTEKETQDLIALTFAKTANEYYKSGERLIALDLHQRAIPYLENLSDKKPLAETLHNMGVLYMHLNRLDESQQALEKSIEIAISNGDYAKAAAYRSSLFALLVMIENTTEAISVFQLLKEASEKTPEVMTKDALARNLVSLAVLKSKIGDVQAGLADYQEALRLTEDGVGPNSSAVSAILAGLGEFYQRIGNLDKGEEVLRRALKIQTQTAAPDHPNFPLIYNNLALVLKLKGNLDEATNLYLEGIRIAEKRLPKNHPTLYHLKRNLACLYADLRQFDKATMLYENSLAQFPQRHQDYMLLSCIGVSYYRQENLGAAETLFHEALKAAEVTDGTDGVSVANALGNLARLNLDTGNRNEAETYFIRSLAIHDLRHDDLSAESDTCFNYATLLDREERREDAIYYAIRSIQLLEDVEGEMSKELAPLLRFLSELYTKSGMDTESEAALERLKRILGS